jgi:hypothetical protein
MRPRARAQHTHARSCHALFENCLLHPLLTAVFCTQGAARATPRRVPAPPRRRRAACARATAAAPAPRRPPPQREPLCTLTTRRWRESFRALQRRAPPLQPQTRPLRAQRRRLRAETQRRSLRRVPARCAACALHQEAQRGHYAECGRADLAGRARKLAH